MALKRSVKKQVPGATGYEFLKDVGDSATEVDLVAASGTLQTSIDANTALIATTSGTLRTDMDLLICLTDYGNETVVSGTNNVFVEFNGNQDDTNYYISTSMKNTTDAVPTAYSFMTTDTTVSGFTVRFSDTIDSNNYSIDWSIVR